MQIGIKILNLGRKLSKSCKQSPHTCIHMNKESDPPVVDIDVFLLDLQKADISIVRNVGNGDLGHQECKKSECQ